MKPPKAIELGYASTRIIYEDGLADSGHFHSERQSIGVDSSTPPANQLNTAYHEITHAIAERAHLTGASGGLTEDQEEHVARIMGSFLAEFHIRNPKAIRWLDSLAKAAREGP